jgi:hypothetical protein
MPPQITGSPAAATLADLQRRVEALESNLKKRDWVDIAGALMPLFIAIVVGWMGWALKDSVDQALAKEQLHLTSVTEMQELLGTLRKPDVTRDAASAAALTLAAFGHYAIPSLMITLGEADDVRAPAAEEGLEAIAASEPAAVCARLESTVAQRNGRHHYMTHLAALRLISVIPCPQARAQLTAYRTEIDRLTTADAIEKFSPRYRQALTVESVQELRTQLSQTLALLDAAPSR